MKYNNKALPFTKEKKIVMDMDGVVADWEKSFVKKHSQALYDNFGSLPKEERVALKMGLSNSNFYRELAVMSKGLDLMETLFSSGYDVAILTSVGKFNSAEVATQKLAWLCEHCSEKLAAHIRNGNFHWTMSSEQKAAYATANTVLIDDREKARAPFIKAGGIAIDILDF